MTSDTLYALPQQLQALWEPLYRRLGAPRLIALANLLAVALLAASLADWTWRVAVPSLPAVQGIAAGSDDDRERFNLQALLDTHLFGQAELAGQQDVPSPDQVPLSSLNLVLNGVVVAGDASIALISASGQPQAPFAISEEITHGAILHAVYPDRVILMRAGVLESLVLQDIPSLLGSSASTYSPPATAHGPTADDIRQLSDNAFSLPRDLLPEQLKNPSFLRDAHIIPRKEGGFLVRKIRPGSLYEKIGLQQGDVIKSVNGEPINSLQDAMSIYQNLDSLAQAQVEVERGGQPQLLEYNLE